MLLFNMSMIKAKKIVFINIRGGLGNQLFCYFVGEFLNSAFKAQVKYLYNSKSNAHDNANSKISSLNLESEIIDTKSFKFYFIVFKLILRALIKNNTKFINKLSIQNFKSNVLFDEIYDEKFLGFEKESEAIKTWLFNSKSRVYYLRGLFQDFNYFDNQPQKCLNLKDPSAWYRQFTEESSITSPIILHVRLGDYLKENGNTLGVLSLEYYQSALNLLREKFPNNEVWVFSNQTAKAKILLMPIVDSRFKFMFEAENKDPAEVLLAMSKGRALITSNSTFSLWSARIFNDLSSIVVPNPFFENMPIYSESFLESCSKVNAKWLTQLEINKLSKTFIS